MPTVTAFFQGNLTVPMYAAPYTIPVTGNPWQFSQGNGEQPLIFPGFLQAVNGGSAQCDIVTQTIGSFTAQWGSTGIYSGTMTLLNYNAASTLTIGNGALSGNIGVPGTTGHHRGAQSAMMFQNNIVIPNVGLYSVLGAQYVDVSLSYTSFVGTRTMQSLGARVTANNSEVTGNASSFSNTCVPISTSRINIALFIETGNPLLPSALPVGNTIGLGSLFIAPSGVYAIQANLGLTGFPPTSTAQQFTAGSNIWYTPDYQGGTNYLWNFSSGSGYFVSSISVNFVVGVGFTPLGAPAASTWITDNAAINAVLTGSTQTATNGGFIMQVKSGAGLGNYFIDKTGTRYWKLILTPGAPGVPVFNNANASETPFTTWIDGSGVVWYIGTQAVTGGVLQPYFSLALNIPFGGVVLPAIPPLAGPCWSPCLSRVGGSPGSLNPTGQAPGEGS